MDLKTLQDIPPWEWPGNTSEMLLGILDDDRAEESDRVLAADLAGDYTVLSDGIAEALLAIVRCGDQIVEALESDHPDIHYQAICAAGDWAVDAAWPHIAALVTSTRTDKPVLLAAIDAVAGIRPQEASAVLADLVDCDDEDIVEATSEALAIADGLPDDDTLDEEYDDERLQ